jgi:2-polyprenyl-3-methyl-5-hydroxy-6-metoxy-1,4-benzoquinol methylase
MWDKTFLGNLRRKWMSTYNHHYVIEGGQAGKARLNVLAQTLEPTTLALFERIGIEQGMDCLDMGSGGGDVTRLLAQQVGRSGRVVGLDFDAEIVRLAEADAQAAGLDQVSFRVTNIYDLRPEPLYDRVYTRFLLTHLPDPLRALRKLAQMLKPGGILIVEDVEMSGRFCYPAFPLFEAGAHLYRMAAQRKGGDPEIGPKLPGLLQAAGLQDVGINLVQPLFLHGKGKNMMSLTLHRVAEAVLAEGLSSASEFDLLVREIAAFEARPDTLVSLPRIYQVWGRIWIDQPTVE